MDSLSGATACKPRLLIIPPSAKEVTLRLARPDERRRWDATMAEHHPLGFRGFAGRGLRYVAEHEGCWLALLGWQSGAFKCGPRDRWIGWRQSEQFPRLHLIANNTRMLMLYSPGTIANLASCVMAANLRRLSDDWQAHFGHPLELAETFVNPSQFIGTMYRAGNWIFVGRTRGFARSNGRYTEPHGCLKEMYLYPLRPDAQARLRAHEPCPSWQPQHSRVAPTDVRYPLCCKSSSVSPIIAAARVASFGSRSCWQSGNWRGCPGITASMPPGATPVISLRMSCAPSARGATSAPDATIHRPAPPSIAP